MNGQQKKRPGIGAKAIAGVSGSILTNILLTPLDVLKVRQQATMSSNLNSTILNQKLRHHRGTLLPCQGCGHYLRNKGGLIDRFFCAASRFSWSATVATTTTSSSTKNYLQCRSHHSLCRQCGNHKHSSLCPSTKKKYTTASTLTAPRSNSNSMHAIFRSVIQKEGAGALWDGLRPALLLSSINVVLYMIAYDELSKDILPNSMGWNAGVSTVVAGGLSRAGAGLIVSPLELIRTQMQSSSELAKKGILRGMKSMVQKDGVLSLYRGYSATMWRDVPFSIIYWYGFEQIKSSIEQGQSKISDHVFLKSFTAGAGSGTIAAFCTTPFDVIKTRRQVMQGKEARTARLLLDICQSEGVSALFSGVAPRVIKVAPACGILIGSYHWVQNFAMDYL